MADTPDTDEPGSIMNSLQGIKKLTQTRVDLNLGAHKKNLRLNIKQPGGRPAKSKLIDSHSDQQNSDDSWFHSAIGKKLRRSIKTGKISIDAMLDLHGYRQHETESELESFIRYAKSDRARMVLIIHGKGFHSQSDAVLRPLVRHWLGQQPDVLAYCPALPSDGGDGATYVYLKLHD